MSVPRSGRAHEVPQLRYPDFLGIGAQKAATSWLHTALRGHPDLWLPARKEIHFFNATDDGRAGSPARGSTRLDTERIESAVKGIASVKANRKITPVDRKRRLAMLELLKERSLTDDWYGRIFRLAPPRATCGEITPAYALLPDSGFQHILRLQPEMKFLFILRDPVDRGWSQLRMIQKRNSAPSAYASEVLRALESRQFFERSDYAATIARVRKFVPDDRLLILYYEDVVGDPAALLKKTSAFLGVDPGHAYSADVRKARHVGGTEVLTPQLYTRLKELLHPVYQRLQDLDSPVVAGWIERHYGGRL